MNLFGGSSFFGMRGGSRRPSHKRRSIGDEVAVSLSDVEAAQATHDAVEFIPKRAESATEDPRWLKRGLFKVGFNAAAPRLRGARKFTK